MKRTLKQAVFFTFLSCLLSYGNICRAQDWNTFGNIGTIPAINFLGTTDAADLRLRTNNIVRGGISASTGFWGIGNVSAFTPQDLLHLDDGPNNTFTRYTNGITGSGAADGFRVGIFNSEAWLQQMETQPMRFFTSNAQRMIIEAGGFVGVGLNLPAFRLDVRDDINIRPITNAGFINEGYRMGGNLVLAIPGTANTFVGRSGNISATPGQNNTYVGLGAGANTNPLSLGNTFGGVRSGFNNQSSGGTFLGFESGENNLAGDFNTFVGFRSGRSNTTIGILSGNSNAFFGGNSGLGNTVGSNNVFIGSNSGTTNTTGDFNTTLGQGSNVFAGNLTNATAIGASALVRFSNNMILGNNNVNVGIGLSGNALGPQDKLEINSNVSGVSGLQFRQLTSASTPVANPGPGILAVNAAGKVIYVTGGGTGTVNNAQNGTSLVSSNTTVELGANPLIHNTDVPLGGFNLSFSGNGMGTPVNNVAIGKNATTSAPLAKLDVLQSSSFPATTGILVQNDDMSVGPNFPTIGIKAITPNITDLDQIAGWFEAPSAVGMATAINVPENGGRVSIGYTPVSTSPNCLVDVNGNVCSFGIILTSDASLKKNVAQITNALPKVKQLRGISYEWNLNQLPDSGLAGTHFGFIAQQVDSVLPEVVKTGSNGKKSVSYTELIPYLVEAIKTQQDQIDSMKTAMAQCCNNNFNARLGSGNTGKGNTENTSAIHIDLNNATEAILYQNEPNPFGEKTTIRYYLPENSNDALVVFYDQTGRIIKTVPITQPGSGSVEINTAGLADGIYSYSFQVNGRTVGVKKMVRSK